MKTLVSFLALCASVQSFAGFRGIDQSGVDKGLFTKLECSTGLSCSVVSGKFRILGGGSTLTLENSETISNATDDVIRLTSDDNDMALRVMGFEAKDAIVQFWADEGDDNADKYSLTSDAATNAFTLKNNATSLLAFSSTGVMTLADSETVTNASDVVTFASDDEVGNVAVKGFEAKNASVTLQADESDDNGDDWAITSNQSGNALTVTNDTSGSHVAKLTMAASDGDITLTGGITGDGGDSLSGLLQAQVASTTVAITAAQCGSTFVSNSADVMTLPEASTVLGCELTFVCGTADDFDINPADATDVLGITGSITGANTTTVLAGAAGDAYRCTDIGAGFKLQAVGADLWAVLHTNGIITDVN